MSHSQAWTETAISSMVAPKELTKEIQLITGHAGLKGTERVLDVGIEAGLGALLLRHTSSRSLSRSPNPDLWQRLAMFLTGRRE